MKIDMNNIAKLDINDIYNMFSSSFNKIYKKYSFINIDRNEFKSMVRETINETKNNYDVLKVKMVYNTEPKQVTYYYYILNGKKLSCITAYSFNLDEADALEAEASSVANSFKWLQ